jgi:hypothetical protein
MDDELDRAAILKRRARLIAAALASVVGAGIAPTGCEPEVVEQDGGGGAGAEGQGGEGGQPQPCLAPQIGGYGGEPQPCLIAPYGGGGEGGVGGD